MACPICGKAPATASDARYRPFCSRRCADIDLGRWLSGSYAIPGEDARPEDLPSADPATPKPRPN